MDDFELLQAYLNQDSDDAFAELIRRHRDLVYSAALRQTAEPVDAEEVTQAVFMVLVKKAASITGKTVLAAWLLRTTHYVAANARRREQRRLLTEQVAMNEGYPPESEVAWKQIAPALDKALMRLSRADRDAVVLRFF